MKIAIILAGVFSFLGMADMPIGYYTFLRIYLTGIAAYLAFHEFGKKDEMNGSVVLFGIIALLFNPFIPVYLHDKEVWSVIDFIAGVIFLIAGFKFKNQEVQ